MGLYIQRDERRSELQEKIAADLREKAARTQQHDADRPDGVEDSAYMEGFKSTTSLAWLWVLVTIFGVGAVVFLFIKAMQ